MSLPITSGCRIRSVASTCPSLSCFPFREHCSPSILASDSFLEAFLPFPFLQKDCRIFSNVDGQIIQASTASEPLSLEEEYQMQASWRTDRDKLTFIVCQPLPVSSDLAQPKQSSACIQAGGADSPSCMLGDVNLFLKPDEEDEKAIIGEIEIMIAKRQDQSKGYGKAALEVFLEYTIMNEEQIVGEYNEIKGPEGTSSLLADGKKSIKYLRVKIGKDNFRSIGLFEKVGFVRTSNEPNYFGEVEMRLEGQRLADQTRVINSQPAGKGRYVEYRSIDTNPT